MPYSETKLYLARLQQVMNKILLICLCVFISGLSPLIAQTPYFNQFHQMPLLNNPAAPAMKSEIQVNLGYKSVNVGSGAGVLNTPVFGFIYPIFQRTKRDTTRIGYAGLTVISDRTGPNGLVNTTGVMGSFAYNLSITKSKKFSVGMHIGYFNRLVDVAKFNTGNQWDNTVGKFDNTLPSGETALTTDSRKYPLVNLGVMYFEEDEHFDNNYYIGFSAQNLNRPITSFYGSTPSDRLPINFNLTLGTTINKSRQVFYTPNLRYIVLANGINQLNIGTLVQYRLKGGWNTIGHGSVGFGAWYSKDNAIITSLELNQPGFNMAFSYDWFTNQMNKNPSSARTTEVVVTLKKFIGPNRPTPKYYARTYKPEPTPKEEPAEVVKPPIKPIEIKDTVPVVVLTPTDSAKTVAPVVDPLKPIQEPIQITEPAKPVQEPVKAQEPVKEPVKKVTPKKDLTKKKSAPKKAVAKKKPAPKKALVKKAVVKKKAVAKKKSAPKKAVVKKEPVIDSAKVETPVIDSAKVVAPIVDSVKVEAPVSIAPIISKQEVKYIEEVIEPKYSFNNANLKEEAVSELDSLLQIMNKYPAVKLEVQGHSCNIGSVPDNLILSERRAQKAVDYLVARGITADRLVIKAIGKAKPKVPNTSEANRIINRRVEFRIIEK
jgi:type IX secretion system PorP/SprF family membrane protein